MSQCRKIFKVRRVEMRSLNDLLGAKIARKLAA
jgi:hypothetical protein